MENREKRTVHAIGGEEESVDLWAFIEGAIGFLSDVTHGGTRLVITFEGKPLGCVVCIADLKRLQEADNKKGESL
mgnify:CR=1 FL=1